MDYVPFLRKCVGSPEALQRFFERLFFGTVTEALSELTLTEETRPFTRIRSLIYQKEKDGPVYRRPKERPRIPVKVLPMDCFLVASQSESPRTWVSGLAQRVHKLGGEHFVTCAQMAYQIQVKQLLADPKYADEDGDYFEAWLRECHPKIYEDIDVSDPAELLKNTVPSESTPKRKHKLGDIRIPNVQEAFEELMHFDPERSQRSSRRERVMAKILVDVYMLCIVDVALALATAEAMLRSQHGRAVIVVYAGADHIRKQVKFWESQGFSSKQLPGDGIVGQEDYEEFEPHLLEMPEALRDFSQLFPVP